MEIISSKLKALRLKHHLSQTQLGKLCCLPQSAISAVENQKRTITVRSLKRICDALNISLADFFTEDPSFINFDRHQLDKIALQVITGKRELSGIENELSNRIESILLTKLRALNVRRGLIHPNRRTLVGKRWRDLKQLYPQNLIMHILDRVDKHLWKYAYEKK
jgi:transcriptional regulator with XRE-family HTH domain